VPKQLLSFGLGALFAQPGPGVRALRLLLECVRQAAVSLERQGVWRLVPQSGQRDLQERQQRRFYADVLDQPLDQARLQAFVLANPPSLFQQRLPSRCRQLAGGSSPAARSHAA
jgi:hypothetical protein